MSHYITLKHIKIVNANCIAGLTWGFPGISHFLGYTHALSRKLGTSYQLELSGCAVVCHKHKAHVYESEYQGDMLFAQTRNPLTMKGETAPITQEGKMHLTVSLVIKCDGYISTLEPERAALKTLLEKLAISQKIAGGTIKSLGEVFLHTDSDSRLIVNSLLPGFVLMDRSTYLQQHHESLVSQNAENNDLLDAWLDFVAIKYQAASTHEKQENIDATKQVEWQRLPKPSSGWLVPLMVGYKAISPLYSKGEVNNCRDNSEPFSFVESIYGVGEWLGLHRLKEIQQALWFYQYDAPFYLCTQQAEVVVQGVEDEFFEDMYE